MYLQSLNSSLSYSKIHVNLPRLCDKLVAVSLSLTNLEAIKDKTKAEAAKQLECRCVVDTNKSVTTRHDKQAWQVSWQVAIELCETQIERLTSKSEWLKVNLWEEEEEEEVGWIEFKVAKLALKVPTISFPALNLYQFLLQYNFFQQSCLNKSIQFIHCSCSSTGKH